MSKIVSLLKTLGPGLLFASMSIGTSHLVLSTKAGAQYGWLMFIPIVLANVLKYPFFEFGVRYTNSTSKSLIEGYLNRGRGYLLFYAFISLFSIFTILAALYVVTAGLLINLLNIPEISVGTAALGLFILISAMLIIGRYKFLETSLKFVVSILFVALLVTTAMVVFKGQITAVANFSPPALFNEVGVLFLIGLVGWMPTTVEASSWISLWTIEKFKSTGQKLTMRQALQEFNFGYFMTGLLAIFFLIIGWMTLYGTNTELSSNSVTFADQLVTLFTGHIGVWSYFFIAIAAFATMFSTCMTAHDAISRVSVDIVELLFLKNKTYNKRLFFSIMVIFLAIINFIVISVFGANMGQLVALATFISFVLAPVIGYMNLKNVMSDDLPPSDRPKKGLRVLTYLGILFLSLFAGYYFWIVVF